MIRHRYFDGCCGHPESSHLPPEPETLVGWQRRLEGEVRGSARAAAGFTPFPGGDTSPSTLGSAA